ncbi:MAG: hypothetical protein ACFCD0_18400 [Gemmataceae bacterium]
MRNKGPQQYSVLTVNGRVYLRRIRWHSTAAGSQTVVDVHLDEADRTISVGVREMACRLNNDSSNFEKIAENLARTAAIQTSRDPTRAHRRQRSTSP